MTYCLLFGAALALVGVGLAEALIAAGLRPLVPVGWPGVGMLVAAALLGVHGFLGGAVVTLAYYVVNAAQGQRFPEFFAGSSPSIAWLAGLLIAGGAIIALRGRLRTAQMATVLDRALRENETRFRQLTELSSDWYWEQDENFRFTFISGKLRNHLGVDVEQHLGKTRWNFPALNLTEEEWARHRGQLERHESFRNFEIQRAAPDGRLRWASVSGDPVFDDFGRFNGYRGVGRDITAQKEAEQALHAARERLERALDGSSAAIWDTDLRTGRVYQSEIWADIVGAPRANTVTTLEDLLRLVHPEDLEEVRRVSLEVMKGLKASYAVEHRVRSATGEWKWILSRGRVTERDPATGRALRMIGTNFDITERKRTEQALQSVAHSDLLTGLANRMLLMDRIRLATARARRSGAESALLYLDIDRFKQVNDSLGHAAGDALLKEFALRLRACVRQTDTVARLGGDEFVILLEDLKDCSSAARIAEKILLQTRAPLAVDGHDVGVTTSIGIAHAAGDADEQAWLARADAALYQAKNAGRDAYRMEN